MIKTLGLATIFYAVAFSTHPRIVSLALLCACSCSSIAAEPACPKHFQELVTASDRAFDNLEIAIKAGDKPLRCRTAKNLVISEQKLLNFLESHQVGCEIDISQIEQQQRRLKRAESWQTHDFVGCGRQWPRQTGRTGPQDLWNEPAKNSFTNTK